MARVTSIAAGVLALPLLCVAPSAQAQVLTSLYSFTGGTDGGEPYAGVIRDSSGNIYGTTWAGGAGQGTIFEVDKTGKETVLHTFTFTDGAVPVAPLVRDTAGNLYGTTETGGASFDGTVFKLDTNGVETVLHSFAGFPDGDSLFAGLVRDAGGNLYGTTHHGGAFESGTVFKLDPTGWRRFYTTSLMGKTADFLMEL